MIEHGPDDEAFEMAISAMIDGELDVEESLELARHIDSCPHCKKTYQWMTEVNHRVSALSIPPVDKPYHRENATVQQADSSRFADRVGFLAPLIAAAVILFLIARIVVPSPQPASADQASPKEVVDSIVELSRINVQQKEDQELMLRTFNLDLRALRLELNQMDLESPKRAALAEQIDLMLEKVRAFAELNDER
ncbi:MAG: zf-HC2 domain-containing protein [Planctomycetota bacterium]